MPIEIQKIGDITKLMCPAGTIPKRMTLDLSEDSTFYHTKIYYDFYDKNTDKTYEGYVECKSKFPSFVNDFRVMPDSDDNKTIFTLTFSDEEDAHV